MANGNKPKHNNMFMTDANVTYNGIKFGCKFNDMDSPYNHSDTYGASAGYSNEKIGKFSLEYSHQKSKSKMTRGTTDRTNMLTFTYSAPIEMINKLFKKRKSNK